MRAQVSVAQPPNRDSSASKTNGRGIQELSAEAPLHSLGEAGEPGIETVRMDSGTRLIPVDELERFLAERRQSAQVEPRPPARPGRKERLPPELVARIRHGRAQGKSLKIARRLNANCVKTSQGGRRWWPSTVCAVLVRAA